MTINFKDVIVVLTPAVCDIDFISLPLVWIELLYKLKYDSTIVVDKTVLESFNHFY